MHQNELVSKQVTQVDNDGKIRARTETHKLTISQCELNQTDIDKSNIHQESVLEDSSITPAPFASLE